MNPINSRYKLIIYDCDGVMLDTLTQIESHLLMRHYEGFMKKGRMKGRTTAR